MLILILFADSGDFLHLLSKLTNLKKVLVYCRFWTMSRDKSVWFAEEILLDAKLINFQLETGEWDAVEEMLRAEAQLSRDAETGRLRP